MTSITSFNSTTLDLGPQYQQDAPFTSRMRRHQSWYRATVLGVPFDTYGNILTAADGARKLNFLTDTIGRVVDERLAGPRGAMMRGRLLHNMLSSQPMCFNLFGPLCHDLHLATRLFEQLLPGEIARVTNVQIEYAPMPNDEYLDDNTAFDAWVGYERPDGTNGFIGIETKLTERFSDKEYDTLRYRALTERAGSPWPSQGWDRVALKQHNQLWRNHLLVEAMRTHPHSSYATGTLMLVRHPGDTGCTPIVKDYQRLLGLEGSRFVDMPLDTLVAAWAPVVKSSSYQSWLDAFTRRYLDLVASGS